MRFVLLLIQLPSALMVLYLDVLSVAAMLWKGPSGTNVPETRFALLVPAHNEEQLVPRLLDSLSRLDYPRELYDVHVVADNCTDNTPIVAAAGGATVHKRQNEQLLGKGYALKWLLAQVRASETRYGAYVIIDADSIASTNLLQVMNRHLARGDQAVQCYYGALNPDESWASALRFASLALFNGLRPRGRDVLGLSAGLHGNGMCFTASVIEEHGWEAFTLAEDVELHLRLVSVGIRVRYAGEAYVLGEMPTSLRQARTQNVRWERGRLQMIRRYAPGLVAATLRQRDPVQLEAITEQVIPPLSVLTALTVLFFLITVPLRVRIARHLATLVLAGQVAYIGTGLRLVRADRRIYLAFLRAPWYVLWKVWIYMLASVRLNDGQWIRTSRKSQNEQS